MLKTVCVLGLGYIGLPTAALLCSKGYMVHGVDVSNVIVETINRGNIHIVEPDLESYVHEAVSKGNLRASCEPCEAEIYIICVPTPFKEATDPPVADLAYVDQAVRAISPFLKSDSIVILESTSPIGTTECVKKQLESSLGDLEDLSVAYCPERVLPGRIMTELVENDRIVGGVNQKSTARVAEFYRTFVSGEVLETTSKVAEMCKLAENSFRDVNIAFANELSVIASEHGINEREVIELANRHPRVNILSPGVGVGGHCIAVDPWFLVSSSPDQARLIRQARLSNLGKTDWVIARIRERINQLSTQLGRQPKVGCLGLAFKPDIDDLRESPALQVVRAIAQSHNNLLVVEPNLSSSEEFLLVDLKKCCAEADLIIVLVKHQEFLIPENRKMIQESEILDFCGL